ncbi:hypothetical protein BCEN4_30022 [Burkholderia cenocepacia]|nr:hypothetical protein BCEN4_30022 [Burkholderia cenocepacia]
MRKIKEGVIGPTGVPLMGELRKNQFTRHLKSCEVLYTANPSDGQPYSHALRVIADIRFTKLASDANFL